MTHREVNWRKVWLWSAVIAALPALLIVFAILGSDDAVPSLRNYLTLWAFFEAMLTPIGVLCVFRYTFDPSEELAERHKARQAISPNSPMAIATERTLRWVARTFGKARD